MWPRARRFGNVYAFATVDFLYTLLWFTAWICIASYVAQGKSEGKSDKDKDKDSDKKTGCDNWKYGNASKCKISTATCIMGVVILCVSGSHFNEFASLLTVVPTVCCSS
jgi:translocation protein SEC72